MSDVSGSSRRNLEPLLSARCRNSVPPQPQPVGDKEGRSEGMGDGHGDDEYYADNRVRSRRNSRGRSSSPTCSVGAVGAVGRGSTCETPISSTAGSGNTNHNGSGRSQGILHRIFLAAFHCVAATTRSLIYHSSMARYAVTSWIMGNHHCHSSNENADYHHQQSRSLLYEGSTIADDDQDGEENDQRQGLLASTEDHQNSAPRQSSQTTTTMERGLLGRGYGDQAAEGDVISNADDSALSSTTSYSLMSDPDMGLTEATLTVGMPASKELQQSPPQILSHQMMQQLADAALPASIGMTKKWVRLYSVQRDGDSFGTFLHRVRDHKFTVIAVKTMEGEIFGGFADTEWERYHSDLIRANYYGTGQSFLFTFSPSSSSVPAAATPSSSSSALRVFKWTGRNNYNQLCDVVNSMVAMGGGGNEANFGLCVQENFRRGSTGSCLTYGNDPLSNQELFSILAFEVYGFVNPY